MPSGWCSKSNFGAGIVDAEQLLRHPLVPTTESAGASLELTGDELRSLRSLVNEISAAGTPERPAGDRSSLAERRFAAEISHLARSSKRLGRLSGGYEATSTRAPSESLVAALEATGQTGILNSLS